MRIKYFLVAFLLITCKVSYCQNIQTENQLYQSLLIAKQEFDSNNSSTHKPYLLAINQLGMYFFRQGKYRNALPFCIEAVNVRKSINDESNPDYFVDLNNLADCYLELRNLKMAEAEYIELSKTTYKNTTGKSRSKYGLALASLGLVNMDMRNYETAETYYIESKNVFDTTIGEYNLDYLSLLNGLYMLFKITKQNEKANTSFKNILRIHNVLKDRNYEIDVPTLVSIGKVGINAKNYDTAYYFLNKALKEYPSHTKTSNHYIDLLFSLAQLQWKRFGVTREVINYMNKINLTVKDYFIQNANETTETDVLDFKSDLVYYNDILFSLLTQNPKNEELLSSALNSQIFFNRISSKIFTKGTLANDYNSTYLRTNEIKKVLGNNDIVVSFLRYRYWDKDPKDSFLYSAFLIRPGEQKPVFISLFEETLLKSVIINEENILKSGEDVYSSLHNQVNNINPESAGLKKMIWNKLLPYIRPGGTIYYSLDGYLNDINMEALTDEGGYFGDSYNLIRMLDLTEIKDLKNDYKKTLQTFSLVGGIKYSATVDTSTAYKKLMFKLGDTFEMVNENNRGSELFEETYENLTESMNEVNTIQNLLLKSSKQIKTFLKDTIATKSNFLAAVKLQPEVLHISTHGFFYLPFDTKTEIPDEAFLHAGLYKFSSDPMDRSGLVFAMANERIRARNIDCMLTSSEIKKLDLSKLQLAVLSGCETGRGQIGFGEGIFGLQRAFKMAGVKYTLVSLYEVDEKQSKEFMVTFYSNLLSKKTVVDAYKATQKDIRTKYPESVEWAYWILLR